MSLPNSLQTKDEVNILFLDASSTCTGYAIAECNFKTRTATIRKTGAIWFNSKWSNQEKYYYVQKALEGYFWIVDKIDFIVHEAYSVNPNRMMGVLVVPEMIGAIKAGAEENGIKVEDILPQSWRAALGIKPIVTEKEVKGKVKKERDFKEPTKQKVLEYCSIPETITSNITFKERATPSDVYDAIGVGLGWLKRLTGDDDTPFFRKITVSDNLEIQAHAGHLEMD